MDLKTKTSILADLKQSSDNMKAIRERADTDTKGFAQGGEDIIKPNTSTTSPDNFTGNNPKR